MTEYCYPECTTSSITGLAVFKKVYPDYRAQEIADTINKAIGYLHSAQRPEGGWFGSWGICFTYATMFALESLSMVGETYRTSERAKRACDWLISKQKEDGGWGESYKVRWIALVVQRRLMCVVQSCESAAYVQHEKSQVVQTAWATLALMYAGYPVREPLARAVRLVMERQLPVS